MVLAASSASVVDAAPGGAALVRIYRDSFGVPHIAGDTPQAMAYGAGYALGIDRLFETDVIRRLAQGRLSEIVGAGSLEADAVMRAEFFDPADIENQYRGLPAPVRSLLEAFSAGVNRAIAEQMTNPVEMSALFPVLGYVPEPWRPQDSVAVLMLFTMVFFAGEGDSGELENAALLGDLLEERPEAEALAVWQDLLLRNDPHAPAVIDHGDGPAASFLSAPVPSSAQIALARTPGMEAAADEELRRYLAVKEALSKLPVPRIGSYGVVANGARTRNGKAVLLGAPQAGFTAPSTFYELGLHAPGTDCTGFTVPGLGPFIGIGWCNGHSWTLVAGNTGDQVDTYAERLNPENPRQYSYGGEWRDMDARTETYVVKSTVSGTPPEVVVREHLSTVHGPVFFSDGNFAYTHRRAQRGHFAQTFEGTLGLNYGRSLGDVTAGAREITATYNFLYADDDGNIAYRFTGWQPVRNSSIDHRLPTPGTGEYEWQSRFLDFDAMPSVVNPARGMINVNQGVDSKPIPWWPRASDVFVGRYGHVDGDRRLFEGVNGLDVSLLEAYNRRLISDADTVTSRFASLVEAAAASASPGLTPAFELYGAWRDAGYPRVDADADGRLDDPAITIFGADNLNFPRSPVWDKFMVRVWAPLAGRNARGPYVGRMGQTLAALESPELFSKPYGDDAAAKFNAALEETLTELSGRFAGAPMSSWLSDAPATPYTAIGILIPRTMKVVDHGTYSQIVDHGTREGVNILPAGNGRADRALDVALNAATGELPPHFDDQLELYENFGFKPMLRRADQYTSSDPSPELLVYLGL